MNYHRRKFRSQSSDNMDRWKSRGWKRQRREEKKREDQRRERIRRKKMQVREKVKKIAKHCGFPMICGSGGSKSRLAKAAGAEPSGRMRDENLHALVARSTLGSKNVQNTSCADHFWKLRCLKSARRCGAKHISKSKCTKHTIVGPLLEVEMSKKCTPLWRKAHFQVKMYKTHQRLSTFGSWHVEKSRRSWSAKHISKSKCTKHTSFGSLLEVEMSKKCTPLWREAHFEVKIRKAPHARTTFERSNVVSRGRRTGFCILPKVSKTWGFCSMSKNDGRRGTFEEDLQRCIFPGRRSTRDMFLRRGCILEHQIFRFAEMILRDRCSTSYDLASLLPGRRNTLDRWSGKIAKRIGTRPSALTQRSIFEGSLAELFRFWCCQLKKLRKSRIALFLTLSR